MTLSKDQCPLEGHNHPFSSSVNISLKTKYSTPGLYYQDERSDNGQGSDNGFQGLQVTNVSGSVTCGASIGGTTVEYSRNASKAFDNRPPYMCLYIWRRIS